MSWPKKYCVVCEQELGIEQVNTRICRKAECQFAYRNHLSQGGRLCVACGRLLKFPSQGEVPLCQRQECQRLMAQLTRPDAKFCRYCGVYLRQQYFDGDNCQDLHCRGRHEFELAEERNRIRVRKQIRFDRLLQVWWETAEINTSKAGSNRDEKSPLPFALPALRRELVAPTDRIAGFRDVLHEMSERVFELASGECTLTSQEPASATPGPELASESDVSSEFTSKLEQVSGAACGLCRGRCCVGGGDTAFLSVEHLASWAQQEGLRTPSELVEAYATKIPDRVVSNSCIFHGDRGCGLPRRMRSNTCNHYACSSLQHLQVGVEKAQASEQSVLLASTNLDDEKAHQIEVFSARQIDCSSKKPA